MSKSKQNYIDSNKLHDLLEEWKLDRQQGREMKKELVSMFLLILNGIINKASYMQYDTDLKEDMKQIAFINLFLYIHNYKSSNARSKHSAFTYVTFSAETSYKSTLSKLKMKREKQQNYIDRMLEDDGFFFDD